ncbi:peroxide operon transcriptional regulator [Lactiplantibacillus fabifermentans DSM 21115]|nr:peroxide operon transcriptional regulator [Lactiplantibacillus fabifermentans DSM 21115]
MLTQSIQQLKNHKIRVTPQRQIILTYLVTHHNHPSVETIYQDLETQLPNLSLATVYNTLKLFVDLGIVIELQNGDAGTHYDFFGRPHYHVVCENCGKITDVFEPDLSSVEVKAAEISGYLVTGHNMEVYGLCPDCQKALGVTQPSDLKRLNLNLSHSE